jgi:hypothetical protein
MYIDSSGTTYALPSTAAGGGGNSVYIEEGATAVTNNAASNLYISFDSGDFDVTTASGTSATISLASEITIDKLNVSGSVSIGSTLLVCGNLTCHGYGAMGATAVASDSAALSLTILCTTSGCNGVVSDPACDASAAEGSGVITGFTARPTYKGGLSYSGNARLVGFDGGPFLTDATTAGDTVMTTLGGRFDGLRSVGATATGTFYCLRSVGVYGMGFRADVGSNIKITGLGSYAFYGANPSAHTGGFTQGYGLYLEAQTRGISNYQVVLAGGATAGDGIWFNTITGCHIGADTASNLYITRLTADTTNVFYLMWDSATHTVGYGAASSRIYKEEIEDFNDEWTQILRVRPRQWIDKNNKKRGVGWVAEELDEADVKGIVHYADGKPKAINERKVTVYIVELLKLQQKRIEELEERIKCLEVKT